MIYALAVTLATGVLIGLAFSLGLSRVMAGYVYGVRSTDPLTYAAAALVLVSIALLACYIPARRAMRIQPMRALRVE